MSGRTVSILAIVVLAASSAADNYHWPWDRDQAVHRRYHKPADPSPNCDQVKEAVAALDASTFVRAMKTSNERQRAQIWKCLG